MRNRRQLKSGETTGLHILLVSQYFHPEQGAPQTRWNDFLSRWHEVGVRVTALTALPNHPSGHIPAEYRGKHGQVDRFFPYRVVRTWIYATPNEGTVRKTLSHLSFMASSVIQGMGKVGRPDIVVVSSPSFFSIFSAILIARRKRSALIVEVRDLWPAVFSELGTLSNRPVLWALEQMELWAYRHADHIVVVTEGFREHISARGIRADKISVLPNGASVERFERVPARADLRTQIGANESDIICMYIGAHGISQALTTLIDSALLLTVKHVKIVMIGDGAAKQELMRSLQDRDLPFVTMLPSVPSDQVPSLLQQADICFLGLRNIPLFSSFIPSKMFEYMAARKAIIGAVQGEAARILNAAGAIVVPPENPEKLATAVSHLAEDATMRRAMGENAKHYLNIHFNRETIADNYLQLITAVANERK